MFSVSSTGVLHVPTIKCEPDLVVMSSGFCQLDFTEVFVCLGQHSQPFGTREDIFPWIGGREDGFVIMGIYIYCALHF